MSFPFACCAYYVNRSLRHIGAEPDSQLLIRLDEAIADILLFPGVVPPGRLYHSTVSIHDNLRGLAVSGYLNGIID